MSEEKHITFLERFGTLKIRQRGPVIIPERQFGTVRVVERNITIPERILTDPVRIVGQTYQFVIPELEILNFQIDEILPRGVDVSYDVEYDGAPEATKCQMYIRTETPLGDWYVATFNTSSFHTIHRLVSSGLTPLTWYHLYIYVWDAEARTDKYPAYPPLYYRFKTGSRSVPGIDDGVYSE